MDSLMKNGRGLSIAYSITAEVYYSLNKKDSAIYFLKKSIALDKDVRNLPNMVRTHQLLAKIYEEKKQTDLAMSNLKLVNELKDSLYDMGGNGQIQEILTRYELEDKEKVIQLLENEKALQKQKSRNQNLTIGLFGVAVALLSLLSIVFWRMRQFQAKANRELALSNQSIALQNEEIQSQAETLKGVNQLKSKLLSVISHDLRGPIANLHSLLELITRQLITPEEFKKISAKLKENLNVTQRTLQNLLNWSLSQMEGIRTEPITFDINSIIKEVIDLNFENATKKNISIHFQSEESISVKADIDQVNLILRNLIHNAIKFSKSEGSINIKSEKQNAHCNILVEDQGIGMTEREVQMILTENEFFTRVGTDQEKGTGLGLLLCKDFIKRNGGKLSIESTAGKGTKVKFTLPLA
jgi:signal transduction histidine kinase